MLLLLTTNPILIAAAVIPAIVLMVYIYRKDKLEQESRGLLVSLVVRGVVATSLAVLTEELGCLLLDSLLMPNSVIYNLLLYFVVVACSEEGFKYLLLYRRTWRSPEFNCQFDGVVYAVFVSLGFALWENIGYVAAYGFSTAIVRALTAVPGHACFGVFMGAWYGMAKRWDHAGDGAASQRCRQKALLIPVLLHGAYDFFASFPLVHMAWIFFAFVLAMFTLALSRVRKLSDEDDYIDGTGSDDGGLMLF